MGAPYVPVVGLIGTDLLKRRDDMVIAIDPFDGKTKTVVAKALRPDVALFHVQTADRHGNVSCGYDAEVVMLAEASKHVIVTAERIGRVRVSPMHLDGAARPIGAGFGGGAVTSDFYRGCGQVGLMRRRDQGSVPGCHLP